MVRFLPETLACTVGIVDTFTSKVTESVTAVTVQAEVKSFLLELAFMLTDATFDWSKIITFSLACTRHVHVRGSIKGFTK